LPDGFQTGGRASITTLPGGRYAVAQFKGPSSSIAETWMRMTREWLPASGLQWDERPCFERFSAATAMDPATGHRPILLRDLHSRAAAVTTASD